MKKVLLILSLIFASFYIFCSDTTESTEDLAIFNGVIYGLEKNGALLPLPNAVVSLQGKFAQTKTDNSGNYSLSFDMTDIEDEETVTIIASKAGYKEKTVPNIIAKKGETTLVPDITLESELDDTTYGGSPTGTSGPAAHIEVFGDHPQHIYVLASGLQETAKINFIVRDAQGVPVDEDHRVRVDFSILNGPNGGEYLNPDTMTTQNGLVFTVLNSGITAGPVQLRASVSVNGNLIWTVPIRVTIFGGLPDPVHFSLAANVLNIAGLRFAGLLDGITAYVGDKYSNPVAPATVVYFSTDYGIVDGSAETDEMGRATVDLMTAAPYPPTPWDSAFVHITGWTYSDTLLRGTITANARVLLTDITAPINVNPTSFTYSGTTITPKLFNYTISDIWGRPVVANSHIRVTATAGQLFGDTDITQQDTQLSGSGTTQFNFTWSQDQAFFEDPPPQVYVNISVTTPSDGNGYKSINVVGTLQ